MANIQYTVPLEAQAKANTCWHASALMIWRYWQGVTSRHGPMNTLMNKWDSNNTIQAQEFIQLARTVGLKGLKKNSSHTSTTLVEALRKHGPLWCAGYWYGPGHIIVLTGVNNDTIYLNDPAGGVKKTGTVAWFNTKSASQFTDFIMYKDPNAY
jgi:ABC-type bacteriocin/lantibiotic exporter with double-glycine peptidase domain